MSTHFPEKIKSPIVKVITSIKQREVITMRYKFVAFPRSVVKRLLSEAKGMVELEVVAESEKLARKVYAKEYICVLKASMPI